MQGNARSVPGCGEKQGGKIGVENSLDHHDRTLRDIIVPRIRKSPAQGKATSTNRIHLPYKSC